MACLIFMKRVKILNGFLLFINLHISGKKHEILEKTVNHELKKLITGFVLTNYVSIIPKAVSCS